MSEALKRPVDWRPEAMSACFRLLEGAGGRPDPKPGDLGPVVTRVHAQTVNGLRQYLDLAAGREQTP